MSGGFGAASVARRPGPASVGLLVGLRLNAQKGVVALRVEARSVRLPPSLSQPTVAELADPEEDELAA